MRCRTAAVVLGVLLSVVAWGDEQATSGGSGAPGDDFLDEPARQCAAGDMVDCDLDLLYTEADTNSEAEFYGATCGGRLETDQDCRQLVL